MSDFDIGAQRAELALRLHAALRAIGADDQAGLDQAVAGVLSCVQVPLALGVARLARDFRETLRELDLDSRISGLAEGEIKDACSHLDQVVRMTEDAAHRTLDLVDDSRRVIDALALRPVFAEAAAELAGLRSNMLSLSMAQEYQDLSGQLIRRVIGLVRNVEAALTDLVQMARPALKNQVRASITSPEARPPTDLKGPSAAVSASQQDADALLADLGF
ncbi:MAG: chemotaxis protein [Hydrocarboniphaga sp.]|uniref:protein phosphatase CheZ n=1 Tax=Hydrocarboniphaga sp. TaxID=2033016 RepID=UPI0026161F51|nr:protein phosphatase CheZ [Hydrocarboniphaga sp.]MDB5972114.1 chemotaxis protein [Hydrocarboniphaga sp.]